MTLLAGYQDLATVYTLIYLQTELLVENERGRKQSRD